MVRKSGNQHQTMQSCCSFCGKSQYDVWWLIAGPGVFICNECVDLCNEIIREVKAAQPDNAPPIQ